MFYSEYAPKEREEVNHNYNEKTMSSVNSRMSVILREGGGEELGEIREMSSEHTKAVLHAVHRGTHAHGPSATVSRAAVGKGSAKEKHRATMSSKSGSMDSSNLNDQRSGSFVHSDKVSTKERHHDSSNFVHKISTKERHHDSPQHRSVGKGKNLMNLTSREARKIEKHINKLKKSHPEMHENLAMIVTALRQHGSNHHNSEGSSRKFKLKNKKGKKIASSNLKCVEYDREFRVK